MAKGTRGWLVGGGAIVLTGVVGAFLLIHGRAQLRTEQGDARGAMLLPSPAGPLLVVFDYVRAGGKPTANQQGYRVIVLDAASGATRALQVIDDPIQCVPAAAGRAWCELDARLALVSFPEIETVAYADELVQRAGLAAVVPRKWRLDGAAAISLLADGRGARIDPGTLAVTPASAEGIYGSGPGRFPCEHASTLPLPDGTKAAFGPGPRSALLRRAPHAASDAPAPPDAPTYVGDPTFLLVGEPDTHLVAHAASLAPHSPLQLSRIDLAAAPRERWTAELGPGRCETASAVGSLLVLSLEGGPVRAVGIDRETGAVRWQLAFPPG